uniref:Putative ovule protein n=1 Tax=Solanum chacoense TaxID=4108 RepID=A0A0V0IA98_SOLCH
MMAHFDPFHSVVFVESILVFELYFPFPDCTPLLLVFSSSLLYIVYPLCLLSCGISEYVDTSLAIWGQTLCKKLI